MGVEVAARLLWRCSVVVTAELDLLCDDGNDTADTSVFRLEVLFVEETMDIMDSGTGPSTRSGLVWPRIGLGGLFLSMDRPASFSADSASLARCLSCLSIFRRTLISSSRCWRSSLSCSSSASDGTLSFLLTGKVGPGSSKTGWGDFIKGEDCCFSSLLLGWGSLLKGMRWVMYVTTLYYTEFRNRSELNGCVQKKMQGIHDRDANYCFWWGGVEGLV